MNDRRIKNINTVSTHIKSVPLCLITKYPRACKKEINRKYNREFIRKNSAIDRTKPGVNEREKIGNEEIYRRINKPPLPLHIIRGKILGKQSYAPVRLRVRGAGAVKASEQV
ncbi:jg18679 [Pararge aegeria aegeria]|uniref:Jg18679 protein n=1 Tax=Pararge aegeria aegeria TaxID=348720 RepID=A0A8S4SAN6_9NEOP|nr:jg18679 [Pararge aegeria aegeria]